MKDYTILKEFLLDRVLMKPAAKGDKPATVKLRLDQAKPLLDSKHIK